jgi:hypothetical protein
MRRRRLALAPAAAPLFSAAAPARQDPAGPL